MSQNNYNKFTIWQGIRYLLLLSPNPHNMLWTLWETYLKNIFIWNHRTFWQQIWMECSLDCALTDVWFFLCQFKIQDGCHCRTKFKYRNLWESKGIFFVSGTRNLSEPKMYINNHWMIPCGDCNPRWQPLQGNFEIGSYRKIFWIILICTIVFSLHIFRKKPS